MFVYLLSLISAIFKPRYGTLRITQASIKKYAFRLANYVNVVIEIL